MDNQPRNDERINYTLRPAKNIERKMICEALGRLAILKKLTEYQYVGFGSAYFTDFTLFHKNLGISKLISIEREEESKERFDFNKPFSCIDLRIGEATDELPLIKWKSKTILWLDYTDQLKGYMLRDLSCFFNNAVSGSAFLISVNVNINFNEKGTNKEKILNKLKGDDDIKKRLPLDIDERDISKSDYSLLVRDIINEEIGQILNIRNTLSPDNKFMYKQIFNFLYKDGISMLTVGGILFDEKDSSKIKEMAFEKYEFTSSDNKQFAINVPNLTYREIHALDKLLPKLVNSKTGKITSNKLSKILSDKVITDYAKLYRYFPTFTEANF